MKFYYIEQTIKNKTFSDFIKINKFSEITFKRSTFRNIILDSVSHEFEIASILENDLDNISSDIDAIFWCSSIIFSDNDLQKKFLKKLEFAEFPTFFGNRDSFIFKGNVMKLKMLMDTGKMDSIITLKNESHLHSILNIFDFKKIISQNTHTRYFNEIISNNETYSKKSTKIKKIELEYLFLKNIPQSIQKYYIQVSDFKRENEYGSYSMQKLSGVDLSIKLINGSINDDEIENILSLLKEYFLILKTIKTDKRQNVLSFLLKKNHDRFNDLKIWSGYKKLNNFINQHTVFSGIEQLFQQSEMLITNNKQLFMKDGALFSHGDLCFSNIIFNESENEITFIDPRGAEGSEVYKTPYYDLAKISHSILGGYDLIVNNVSSIEFDKNMNAYLDLNKSLTYNSEKIFTKFVEGLGYNMKLVKIIEASLFVTMLPLHTDDIKKITMLSLRASELIGQLSKQS